MQVQYLQLGLSSACLAFKQVRAEKRLRATSPGLFRTNTCEPGIDLRYCGPEFRGLIFGFDKE